MNTKVMKATFKDIMAELWLRKRNSGCIVWTTKDGKKIPIKDLSDEHLVNIVNMLLRNKEAQEEYDEIMDHLGDMNPLEYYD